jgi:hypothetical protein
MIIDVTQLISDSILKYSETMLNDLALSSNNDNARHLKKSDTSTWC